MHRILIALCVLCGAETAVHAQLAPSYLDPAHWASGAMRRINIAGIAPVASDPTIAPLTRAHTRSAFAHAERAALDAGRDDLARLARAFLDLMAAEADTTGPLARVAASAGWASAEGDALAGQGYFREEDWTGAQPLAGVSAPVGIMAADGHLTSWLSWNVHAGTVGSRAFVRSAVAGVRAGVFDAWIGRRPLHYGTGYGGSTVLAAGLENDLVLAHRSADLFDGAGIHVREPFLLPSYLRALGPIRIEAAIGKLDSNGNVEQPYVAFGRLSAMPFTPRFTFAVNRGAIFGGEGNPVTAGRLLGLLFGMHGGEEGEFENQVFSAIARIRPPLDRLGAELYAEVGMDDTAGAIKDTPGVIAGIEIGYIPGVPALSLAVERTDFARSCCGNPVWYRSVFFRGSWGEEGRLFAHPLGGHGREWLVHARLDLPQQGWVVRADAFTRDRGEENLFAPEREGRSRGGAATLEYSHASGLGLRADATIERADTWRSHRAAIVISYSFRESGR